MRQSQTKKYFDSLRLLTFSYSTSLFVCGAIKKLTP
nr:MAG TPA: hypothetical protein [Bacteriophage sp.]DAY22305.1 MAG TPA: hypothetical protein [Bacteriophage sp.]